MERLLGVTGAAARPRPAEYRLPPGSCGRPPADEVLGFPVADARRPADPGEHSSWLWTTPLPGQEHQGPARTGRPCDRPGRPRSTTSLPRRRASAVSLWDGAEGYNIAQLVHGVEICPALRCRLSQNTACCRPPSHRCEVITLVRAQLGDRSPLFAAAAAVPAAFRVIPGVRRRSAHPERIRGERRRAASRLERAWQLSMTVFPLNLLS